MYKNLDHLTKDEIEDLMSNFYNGERTAKDIISEYKLDVVPARLYLLFPALEYPKYQCEYCGCSLVVDRKPKSNNKYFESDLYCPRCIHKPFNRNCGCDNCYAKAQLEVERKRAQVKAAYATDCEQLWFEDLTFTEKVYLGALSDYALKENLYDYTPYKDIQNSYALAPTDLLRKEMYETLVDSTVIRVSPLSELSAFVDDEKFPEVYYVNAVMYSINLFLPANKRELFEKIRNPNYYNDYLKNEALVVWKKIAVAECIEYLVFQLSKVNFEFEAGQKTYQTFDMLLNDFSVAQIYGIVWKAVADSSRLYLEGKMSKAHAANTTIGSCQRYAEKAISNNWKLNEYGRIRELPQSELARFFFNRVLQIGDLGFTMPPML